MLLDNLPGYPGQSDARTRWPHLGRAVQAAQSGGGQPRREAVPAKGAAEAAAVPVAAWRSRTGTSSPSTRTAASRPDLQDPSGAYPETTGATETADRLYIHSLHAHGDRLAAAMRAPGRHRHPGDRITKQLRGKARLAAGGCDRRRSDGCCPGAMQSADAAPSQRPRWRTSTFSAASESRTNPPPAGALPRKPGSSHSRRTPSGSSRSGASRWTPPTARSWRRRTRASPNCAPASVATERTGAAELLCRDQAGLDLLSRQRRVPRAQGRFPGGRPLPGPLSARSERIAGPLCRRASDDEYDDEQGRLRRRHRSARLHPGLDRHDSPLEIQVGRARFPFKK